LGPCATAVKVASKKLDVNVDAVFQRRFLHQKPSFLR
jgi:hypothetical protein